MKMSSKCPCGSDKKYESCCEIAHKNIKTVASAEALMRSRYSAFAKADIDYLLQSWSFKTRDNSKRFRKELLDWTTSVEWIKLKIVNTTKGTGNFATGTVSFEAYYIKNAIVECISENSFFEKEEGCWMYVKAL